MYREIKREPLGIRKLDVQEERRESRKTGKSKSRAVAEFWFRDRELTLEEIIRFGETMFEYGWESGVHTGAKATRDRVAESLANGRLVKTR